MPSSTDQRLTNLEEEAAESFRLGDWENGIAACREWARFDPDSPKAFFLLGAGLHQLNRLEEALSAFLRVLEIDRSILQASLAAATLLSTLGRHEEALGHCQTASKLAPTDPVVHTNIGIIYEALHHPEKALTAYERALAFAPEWPDALKNRGILLLSVGRIDHALLNNHDFVHHHPQRSDAHFNLGESCLAAHDYKSAADAFAAACRLSPADARAKIHHAFALSLQERFAEAQALLNIAYRENPSMVAQYHRHIFPTQSRTNAALDARTFFAVFHFERADRCDWRDREHILARFSELLTQLDAPKEHALAFEAMALGVDPRIQLDFARRLVQVNSSQDCPVAASGGTAAHIRIGYLSPDFREHAVGRLSSSLFGWHDRQQFEVFCYSIGPDVRDPIRSKITAECDVFRNLGSLPNEQATEQIRADQIDLLIDLAGYTDHARPGILAHRPAALQLAWLGYMTTTGGPHIDYFVADAATVPAKEAGYFSEAIIRLPDTLWLCSYASPLANRPLGRPAAGLPEAATVLAAFHRGYKICPEVFGVWMRLLHAVPDAVLWLTENAPGMTENLVNEASARGIASNRLIFAPPLPFHRHLERFACADLFLDTPRYNGGATVCDALVAGVPVLTCAGKTCSQRMAASALASAGFMQGVTNNLAEYEQTALSWIQTPGKLAALRQELAAARIAAPFYQPQQWVRYFEKALKMAVMRHRAGLRPTTIDVPG